MKILQKFLAEDGRQFDNKYDCEMYEGVVLESFRRQTKQRISEIPDMIRSVIEATIKYGYENKVGALSSSDHSLGLEHISSKLDKPTAEKAILEFEAVKTIIAWATKKGFGHEISICNGYWELFLTW